MYIKINRMSITMYRHLVNWLTIPLLVFYSITLIPKAKCYVHFYRGTKGFN